MCSRLARWKTICGRRVIGRMPMTIISGFLAFGWPPRVLDCCGLPDIGASPVACMDFMLDTGVRTWDFTEAAITDLVMAEWDLLAANGAADDSRTTPRSLT